MGAGRHGTAVMFQTLEDEFGIVNAVVRPTLYEHQRRVVLFASMKAINGRIQREGDVVHLVAQLLFDLTDDLGRLGEHDEQFPLPMAGVTNSHAAMVRRIRASGRRLWCQPGTCSVPIS